MSHLYCFVKKYYGLRNILFLVTCYAYCCNTWNNQKRSLGQFEITKFAKMGTSVQRLKGQFAKLVAEGLFYLKLV